VVGSDQHHSVSVTQEIEFDLGDARSADFKLQVPKDLRDLHLTSDGEELSYAISNRGNTLTATAEGGREVFSITLDESGDKASYTFTLKDRIDHETADGENVEDLPFNLVMRTSDKETLVGRFTVEVVDDVPQAKCDFDTVQNVTGATTSGNVITGIDTDSSVGAALRADTAGADGDVSLTSVTFEGQTVSFTNPSDVHVAEDGSRYLEIDGEHGRLTIQQDGSYTYTVTDINAGDGESVTIDIGNYDDDDQGFHVSALTLDNAGNYVAGDVNHYSGQWGTGFGVEGNKGGISIGVDEETGYVPKFQKSEKLIIDFDKDVQAAGVTLDTLFDRSVDARVEVGKITAYLDGEEVGQLTFKGQDASGDLTLAVDFGHNFDRLVFEGMPYEGGQGGITTDSSDFLVRAVTFETVDQPISDSFIYTIVDQDGDVSSATLGINVDPVCPPQVPDPVVVPADPTDPSSGGGLTEMTDVPSFDHDLSNIVLYLDDGTDVTKIKIEDFPSGSDGVHDANMLPIEQFVADNYPEAELVGITIKAGDNHVDAYGPGEGEFFSLKDGITEADLPMADKADETYSFNQAFDDLEMGELPAGSSVEESLGVTMGDQQGLEAGQDDFVFGAGDQNCGGSDQDGWTEMVLGDGLDGSGFDHSGWSKSVTEHVEVKDGCHDQQPDQNQQEEKPAEQSPDSIDW
jgi:hypothetical protein